MKIVVCKNCGVKYQLDDSEDIDSFECSICTGSLELETSDEYKNEEQIVNQENIDDAEEVQEINEYSSVIVYCVDCGLKFELDASDNINEFECTSCDGSLRYVDDELNKIYGLGEISEETNEQPHEVEILDSFVNSSESTDINEFSNSLNDDYNSSLVEDYNSDEHSEKVDSTNDSVHEVEILDSFVGDDSLVDSESYAEVVDDSVHEVEILDSFVSSNESINSYEESSNYGNLEIPKNNSSSPRTLYRNISDEEKIKLNETKNSLVFNSVEEYEQYKLALFKHYDDIKDSMKYNYISGLDNEIFGTNSMSRLFKNDHGVVHPNTVPSQKDIKKDFNLQHGKSGEKPSLALMVIGAVVIILGIILYALTLKIMLLTLLVLGLVLIIIGAYKKSDVRQKEVRSKIIRDKLEQLPENFYLFYYTKPPYAKNALNHVVVGPTGVYTILSQKYASKDNKNKLRYESENDSFIYDNPDIGNYIDKKNTLELTSGYEDNQTRFQFGNEEIQFNDNSKIKHKSLTLNEDLAIFLDKMGLSGVYIEPLIGFINEDVAIINVVLTNEDLFLDELLYRIANGPRRLDDITVMKIAKLLSKYSINCAMV